MSEIWKEYSLFAQLHQIQYIYQFGVRVSILSLDKQNIGYT